MNNNEDERRDNYLSDVVIHHNEKKKFFSKDTVKGLIIGLVVAAVVCTAVFMGIGVGGRGGGSSTGGGPGSAVSGETQQKITDIMNLIDEAYLYEYDQEEIERCMLLGLVSGLHDPYSTYYSAEEYETVVAINQTGDYEGIGVTVLEDVETGQVEIIEVHRDTPAEKVGLKEGDVIIAVDDVDVTGESATEIVVRIRGNNNPEVAITVNRAGEELRFDIVKEHLTLQSVSYEMLEDDIAYISVGEFTAHTAEQFTEAKTALEEQGARAFIFDMRDNPGGLLYSVVDVLNQLVPEGVVLYTEDKNGDRIEYSSSGENVLDKPAVVLVNEGTASAAEIFTGAMRDYDKAVVVGTTTYGKGLVQNLLTLSDGSVLRITIAEYFTPSGFALNGVGLEPDITVERAEDSEEDVQLKAAIEYLEKQINK